MREGPNVASCCSEPAARVRVHLGLAHEGITVQLHHGPRLRPRQHCRGTLSRRGRRRRALGAGDRPLAHGSDRDATTAAQVLPSTSVGREQRPRDSPGVTAGAGWVTISTVTVKWRSPPHQAWLGDGNGTNTTP